jgi:hypothetical protein
MRHTACCIEMARLGIADNNLATVTLEPGRELVPETDAMALEWLCNGNAECYQPELCEEL